MEIDNFKKEVICIYKGEKYSVRDNGAILRHPKNPDKPRPNDNVWTFGKREDRTGYLIFSRNNVHRIVATAFLGDSPSEDCVIEHVDRDRINNSPTNLRWITMVQYILEKQITRKKLIARCGSVEEFLKNPSLLKNDESDSNFYWMADLKPEQAQVSSDRIKEWAEIDKAPIAIAINWKTSTEFPNIPKTTESNPLKAYFDKLTTGAVFSKNKYGEWGVENAAICEEERTMYVLVFNLYGSHYPWALAKVTFDKNAYFHESIGNFRSRVGAIKYFTLAQGLEWSGGNVIEYGKPI